MDTILQILQWAIPSGGIGAAIAWIANRKAREAKAAKEVHDTYKTMYEDISQLLVEVQQKYEETKDELEKLSNDNVLTRRALNRLSKAIEAIQTCPHRNSCPIRDELQIGEDGRIIDAGTKPRRGKGQRNGDNKTDESRKDTTRDCTIRNADRSSQDSTPKRELSGQKRACDSNY